MGKTERSIHQDKINGFSLIELMVSLVIGATVTLGFAQLLSMTADMQAKAMQLAAAENFKENILRALTNNTAWGNTLQANSGGTMACLWQGVTCNQVNQPFILYDDANAVVFDSRNAANGFTSRGQLCSTFSQNPGNPACPMRYDLTWTATCSGTDCTPTVTATLVVPTAKDSKSLIVDNSRLSIANFQVRMGGTGCGGGSAVFATPGTWPFTVPKGWTKLVAEVWGAGGGGAGINSASCGVNPGAGGGTSTFASTSAPGGAGQTNIGNQSYVYHNLCVWVGGYIGIVCAGGSGTLCGGGLPTYPGSNGDNGYSGIQTLKNNNLYNCTYSAGTGGGYGGQAEGAVGSPGGGGGGGGRDSGAIAWCLPPGVCYVRNWWATGAAAGQNGAQPPPASGSYAIGVYSPASLNPGSIINVVVGAGGAGGYGNNYPGGAGASGLIRITWQ
jgi:prepilin-type N-terminal cleavage/methylation domain-containing protein